MGGNVMFVASAEYSLPLFEDMLRGVIFCDAGSVRHSFSSTHGLDEDDTLRFLPPGYDFDDGDSFFSDLRVAIGFGLRIRIPALGPVPLALDLGFPIKEQDGDDTQVISFSIERRF
jgi:outer membrane protein insertion porin family